ncbi:hypothetical protein C8R45DRAFT_943501 [Mycena sanguinolenta]|nr:hypothetical protein C8R45DRAFT_943501 [Mycena sanguinolenta]
MPVVTNPTFRRLVSLQDHIPNKQASPPAVGPLRGHTRPSRSSTRWFQFAARAIDGKKRKWSDGESVITKLAPIEVEIQSGVPGMNLQRPPVLGVIGGADLGLVGIQEAQTPTKFRITPKKSPYGCARQMSPSKLGPERRPKHVSLAAWTTILQHSSIAVESCQILRCQVQLCPLSSSSVHPKFTPHDSQPDLAEWLAKMACAA